MTLLPGATRAGLVTPAYVRERAARFVAERPGTPHAPRILLIRAQPVWPGGFPSLQVGTTTVWVCEGVSQFAILDAYLELPDGDLLIVLTDRTEHDLGDAVLLRAHGAKVEALDEWDAVPGMYSARRCDRELRRLGSWVPSALLEHQPPGGWPAAPGGSVTTNHALGNLLAQVLGLRLPADLDAVMILDAVNEPVARAAWANLATQARSEVTTWAEAVLGPVAGFALRTAAADHTVSTLAIGIAIDVLWPDSPTDRETPSDSRDRTIAQGRLERFIGGAALEPVDARAIVSATTAVVARMARTENAERIHVLQQAEAFLVANLAWPDGPTHSRLLHGGLTARLRDVAALLVTPTARTADIEAALGRVLAHDLAAMDPPEVQAARMAVRLHRWLSTPEPPPAASLSEALLRHAQIGGWVARATAGVWDGSSAPEIANAYRVILTQVAARQAASDAHAASLLQEHTQADGPLTGAYQIEDLLRDLIAPAATHRNALVVVVDGMSARVATQLVEDATLRGWVEWVPTETGRRTAALVALPSMTTYSRTSLFAGRLLAGKSADEKRTFNLLGGTVFHKGDLESAAGERIPVRLAAAIDNPEIKILGVVLNTVDDALGKHDPGGTTWNVDAIRHLSAVLAAARLAKRMVVLTSDHGHVIERGGEHRPIEGADARWRLPGTGPVQDGEIALTGRRVLAPGGSAILAWRDDLRFGNKQAGYHGGASLEEITVPLIVLNPSGETGPSGWSAAPPQAPVWWNDPAPVVVEAPSRRSRAASPRKPVDESQGTLGFDLAIPVATAETVTGRGESLVESLLSSPLYQQQRARAGRRALADDMVRTVVTVLIERGGRAHQDTLAQAAAIPTASIEPTLAALRRLLNVDSYGVIQQDADRVTVILEEALLREQFEIPARRVN